MTQTNTARWHAMRNDESRLVEKVLREGGFEQVDASQSSAFTCGCKASRPRAARNYSRIFASSSRKRARPLR